MLEFAAIIPSSPDILSEREHSASSINKNFSLLADELVSKKIHHLVFLLGNPVQKRASFALQTSDVFSLSFRLFGDLSTRQVFEPWWEGISTIREHFGLVREFVDEQELNYRLSVPLKILSEYLPAGHALSLAILHIPDLSTEEERKQLGQTLSRLQTSPFAAFLPAALAHPKVSHQFEASKRLNGHLRDKIGAFTKKLSLTKEPGLIMPDFTASYEVLAAAVQRDFVYQELLFAQLGESHLLIGRYEKK